MARRTAALKPQLNQIRTWAREGRTDAWIAYQLGTTALTVQEFRSEHGLDRGGGNTAEAPVTPEQVVQTISFDTPPPAPTPALSAEEPADAPAATRPRRQRRSRATPAGEAAASKVEAVETVAETTPADAPATDDEPDRAKRRRRRGGRGGAASSYGGSLAAGAVIVLDPAVAKSAAWRAHWADVTAFDVVVEDDQIVLRRPSD